MSKLSGAMKLRMEEIVLVEDRPFSYLDFAEFEVGGQTHKMKHGTFRNYILKVITVKQFANNCPGFENDEIIREVTKVNSEFYHDFVGN